MHKFWNFSQSGVANDPIFVAKSVTEKFKLEFERQVKRQYGVHTRTNLQVASTLRYARNVQGLELNDLHAMNDREQPLDGNSNKVAPIKRSTDIDVPLMQDEQGSSLVSMVEFDTIETVINELTKSKVSGIHYYGASGSKARKLLEERLRSPYFIVNDSPLQQCNIFSPLGNRYGCGLGRIKGFEGTSYLPRIPQVQ
jgi:acyl-CoA reductase-like NAD-dependent aldehyde dehydrogenase